MLRELAAPFLLAATGLGLVAALRRREPDDENAPWRAAIVKAAVLLGVFIVASVEGLSAFGLLRAVPLAVAWGGFLVVAWLAALTAPPAARQEPAGEAAEVLAGRLHTGEKALASV